MSEHGAYPTSGVFRRHSQRYMEASKLVKCATSKRIGRVFSYPDQLYVTTNKVLTYSWSGYENIGRGTVIGRTQPPEGGADTVRKKYACMHFLHLHLLVALAGHLGGSGGFFLPLCRIFLLFFSCKKKECTYEIESINRERIDSE